MEKGKQKGILISLIFGALFAAGIVTLWVFIIREINKYGGNLFRNPDEAALDRIKWAVLFIIITAGSLAGLVLNIIAWLKQNEKFVLFSGIAYIFGANPISAIICFVEYFDIKMSIKNKALLYTALFSCLLAVLWTILWIFTERMESDDSGMMPFWLFTSITMGIGVVFNFLAWKKYDDEKFRAVTGVIAGAFYILGSITVIQAIICFIRTGSYIKNKLLFYTALCSCLFAVFWSILWIFMGRDVVGSTMPFILFTSIAMGIGVVFNFLAWKTGIKKMKIIAGIIYLLGIFTVISAIICFICSRDNRKLAASS